MKRFLFLIALFGSCSFYAQTALPVSRTSWSATPAGWTDSYGGLTYTSVLACDGNSNRARLSVTGAYTEVFFSGNPNVLSFDLQGNGNDAISFCLVEQSPDGSTWSTVDNISSISGSCVTHVYTLICASTYVRWTYTKSAGNIALDNVSISSTTCGGSSCPTLTGAILNSCDNGVAGCDEGDAEIMLFNSGSYSLTVSSLPSHLINYYGSTVNFNAGTINAYAGTASSNASVTSSLNSSTGCGAGSFIDANTAGTIPANSTFIMVPNNFCYTNYNFSNLCASFSPIYVVYFSTVGWSSSGNLANYQAGSNPKYITTDFSWADGSCGLQYYTFDAGSEYTGNGASIAFPGTASTSSATPTSPNFYTGAAGGCTLPIVLPINLIEFKAEVMDATISRIKFTTSDEKNVKQYIVSKSVDGFNYLAIDHLTSLNKQERTNYFSYDRINKELNNIVYYHLEEEDFNGVKKNIGTCFLELKPVKEIIVNSNEAGISIAMPVEAKSIELLSLDGKNIIYVEGNENELLFQINLEGVAKGFYLLRITDINEKVTIKKIIY